MVVPGGWAPVSGPPHGVPEKWVARMRFWARYALLRPSMQHGALAGPGTVGEWLSGLFVCDDT